MITLLCIQTRRDYGNRVKRQSRRKRKGGKQNLGSDRELQPYVGQEGAVTQLRG